MDVTELPPGSLSGMSDNSTLGGDDEEMLKLQPDPGKCNHYLVHNKTHIFYGGYEGIPENILINFCGWIVSTDYERPRTHITVYNIRKVARR